MVKLRLMPTGKKKSIQPSYKIIVINSKAKINSKYIDKLGNYNPLNKENKIIINEEKTLKYLMNGAQPTETVRSLLSSKGIMTKFHNLRQEKNNKNLKK